MKAHVPVLISVVTILLGGCAAQERQAPESVPALTTAASPTPTPTPVNPVDIARKIKGCRLEDGASIGKVDAMGGRFVSCDFMNNGGGTPGTTVTVRTYTASPQLGQLPELTPDDDHDVILGDNFSAVVTGAKSYRAKVVDPELVAEQVGGKLQTVG